MPNVHFRSLQRFSSWVLNDDVMADGFARPSRTAGLNSMIPHIDETLSFQKRLPCKLPKCESVIQRLVWCPPAAPGSTRLRRALVTSWPPCHLRPCARHAPQSAHAHPLRHAQALPASATYSALALTFIASSLRLRALVPALTSEHMLLPSATPPPPMGPHRRRHPPRRLHLWT